MDDTSGAAGPEKPTPRGAALFGLLLVMLINLVNSTQQYLLTGTIFGMANELEFGSTGCVVDNETVADLYAIELNVTPAAFCAEKSRCDTNSSSFAPGACKVFYTGQGTQYDLLAGPIYLIIQGVATMPILSLFQVCSLRFNVSLALMTITSSLCILFTAFVQDYWAIALLRFLFGIFSGPATPLGFSYLSQVFSEGRQALVFGIAQYGFIAGVGLGYLFFEASDVLGWRQCYIIGGGAGTAVGLAAIMVRNPPNPVKTRKAAHQSGTSGPALPDPEGLFWSVLVPLIVVRVFSFAGYQVSSFNLVVYLYKYYPGFDIAIISVTLVVAGLPGAIAGGAVTDRLYASFGVTGRLVISLALVAMSFGTIPGTFLVPPPYMVISVALSAFFADFLITSVLSALSDLTPLSRKTTIFGLTYFAVHSIGGASNLLVTPTAEAVGLRSALILLLALAAAGKFAFLVIEITLVRLQAPSYGQKRGEASGRRSRTDAEDEEEETTPLICSDVTN